MGMAMNPTPETFEQAYIRTHLGDPATRPAIAEDRDETDPCQRGTTGCCIDHRGNETCETW